MTVVAESLRKKCDEFLNESATWATRLEQLRLMHELFVSLGALNAYGEEGRGGTFKQVNGKAIAPAWAGMCLFDVARSWRFISGVLAAIEDKVSTKSKPVHLIDAGCGPYALLSLIPALYFTAEELQLTVLDIYEANTNSVTMLVNRLGLHDHFAGIHCMDALHFTTAQSFDIVVTETMNRALSEEPQVAISLHLARFLFTDGLLIPAMVQVDVVCCDLAKKRQIPEDTQQEQIRYPQIFETRLATILSLNKYSTVAQLTRNPLARVNVPSEYNAAIHQLQLHTTVQVYKEHILYNNESGITLPVILREPVMAGTLLHFHYNMGASPGVEIARTP